MNKFICNGISVCTSYRNCSHGNSHEHGVYCDRICLDQKDKGNFHCKNYTIVMRKIKLNKLKNK